MTQQNIEQLPDGWEEKAWDSVPIELKQIARRHGQRIFGLVMQAGIATYANGVIAQRLRNDRRGMEALTRIAAIQNQLMEAVLGDEGKAAFLECRKEVNIIAQLHDATAESAPGHSGISKGGIILNG